MKQTITINPAPQEKTERSYPYLGKSNNGYLIWFVRPRTGIAIEYIRNYETVNITSYWEEDQFTPFDGTLDFKVEGAE